MTKVEYEIEEETGGYVRNGDVLEWHWKGPEAKASQAPSEPEEKAEQAEPPKKRGRPKKEES